MLKTSVYWFELSADQAELEIIDFRFFDLFNQRKHTSRSFYVLNDMKYLYDEFLFMIIRNVATSQF